MTVPYAGLEYVQISKKIYLCRQIVENELMVTGEMLLKVGDIIFFKGSDRQVKNLKHVDLSTCITLVTLYS